MRGKDNPCYGCTEATGRTYNCHTLCDGYKQFQDDCKEEKNVIKRKNPYYKSLSKEKFMKRNALNRISESLPMIGVSVLFRLLSS